ncbi:MAG: MFS transporter [Rhodospirillaceae bacterium]|jgi:MFS transporter, PPP family, 3-phenylpropionic acid transporter|nr:MFS transporter [Rhodospirillaceae bacterium]MBT5359681.1 MFS transporter [Rhodospirillaceae bacterium]MBT5945804.1 MFS transporter [Rhodospirillaceae bacterium]MBT6403336.1 MFS transporter [Rhodospirillaceae bacterium]MBT7360396.1 MFS transporter [Rhodospirillaceae bacterium]
MTETPFRTSLRFALFYGAVFFVLGVVLPFWPIWLQSRGLSPADIGIILAVGPWMRVLVDPVITRAADHGGRGRRMLVFAAALSLIAFSGFSLVSSFWLILLITLVYAPSFHALIPLGDSQTMSAVLRHKLDYGRIRLWGSVTFILGTLGVGALLTGRDPDIILLVIGLGLVAVLVTTLFLREQNEARGHARWSDVLAFVRQPRFLAFVLAASAVQASHAVLNGFSSIHWKAAGHSELVVGLLWGGSVVVEIILFAFSGAVVARVGASRLLLLGAGTALVRWLILAETVALPGLIVAQAMHAITFGATYLATMHYIAGNAPEGLKATAQGAYASLSGIIMGLALIGSGALYSAFTGGAFYAMAGLSALALLFAMFVQARSQTHI